MALQHRMELQYRQEMTINPRLYQAMDLLQMPLLDLQLHLKQELMVNPFLELIEESEEGVETTDVEAEEDSREEGEEELPEDSKVEDSKEESPGKTMIKMFHSGKIIQWLKMLNPR